MLKTSFGAHTQQVSQDAEDLPESLGKTPDVLSYSESVGSTSLCQTPESQQSQTAHSAREAERRRKVRRGTELKEEGR